MRGCAAENGVGWAEGWSRLYLLLEPAGALNVFRTAPVPSAQSSASSLRVAFWATHVVQWLCCVYLDELVPWAYLQP